ncbi:GntR family transcriptional regulator [Tabrizicola sp. BL-A-41-H6]|uniref:GntR family transcriptional regulator n=1 Tax=Tabrizicola sp. BL-A-41-H6 TaxID=3421107 RepID=UPI003D666C0C
MLTIVSTKISYLGYRLADTPIAGYLSASKRNRSVFPQMTAATYPVGKDLSGDEAVEESIVERIFSAVVEQRLPPGTKLSESALCQAFGVGRMHIRRSLLLLSSREVVELHPNRGAFVASPTAKQAREVFEARMALEPTIARLAVERATSEDIATLSAHLQMEHDAHHNESRHEAIRLSGQFHILLAQIASNAVMLRMMKELVTRTSLIIGIFGAPSVANCRDDDHELILSAFTKRDPQAAANLMANHLREIEGSLNLDNKNSGAVDLVSLFSRG